MIKIISGIYKNRKLKYFNLKNVRPTQSKIRKSMMESLYPLKSKCVLDLFSGIGTLGIESLSREAQRVVFVDNNRRALEILRKNLDLLSIKENYKIINLDAFRYLKSSKEKFDIILADPPYGKYDFFDFLPFVEKLLKKDGVFCYECKKTKVDFDLNTKIKSFGNTQIIYWRK
tara:strand:+ start:263 stop:781 length:519 start_codon:yes stop_codon:yes gene_type:complete